jgi:hypothetical protein
LNNNCSAGLQTCLKIIKEAIAPPPPTIIIYKWFQEEFVTLTFFKTFYLHRDISIRN